MLRAVLLASGLLLPFGGPAVAQSNFDATGQFTLSFKFSKPGEENEKPKPRLGFRFGASNVPQVRIEESDPTRRGLNLEFDRTDQSIQSFAGVEVQFGEADEKTIRLLDDSFSPAALGLVDDETSVDPGNRPIAGYLRGNRIDDDGSAWSLGSESANTFSWSETPLSE